MNYPKIILKPGKEDSFHRFHPWVFSGAIYRFEKQPEEGDIVEVTDHQGNFIGVGQYQIGSIAVRILSFKPVSIDEAFYVNRLQEAYNVRLSSTSITIPAAWYTARATICRGSSSTSTTARPSCRPTPRACTTPAIR